MIFMTCSTVTPGFGVRIVNTPVILGCGGVDWLRARGARTVANASSGNDIAMFMFSSFAYSTEFVFASGTTWYHMPVRRWQRRKGYAKNLAVVLCGTTGTSRRRCWLRRYQKPAKELTATRRYASASLMRPLRRSGRAATPQLAR